MKAGSATTRTHLSRLGTLCVALTIALSLVFVTGVRRAAMAAFAQTEAEYAQFLAAGGSVADLCRDGKIAHPGSAACDACCMAVLAVLPRVVANPLPFQTEARPHVAAPVAGLPGAAFSNPAAPVRGPPLIA